MAPMALIWKITKLTLFKIPLEWTISHILMAICNHNGLFSQDVNHDGKQLL